MNFKKEQNWVGAIYWKLARLWKNGGRATGTHSFYVPYQKKSLILCSETCKSYNIKITELTFNCQVVQTHWYSASVMFNRILSNFNITSSTFLYQMKMLRHSKKIYFKNIRTTDNFPQNVFLMKNAPNYPLLM